MVSLNVTMIIGNVGKDVEMRFTPSGNPVATFSVAVNHNYKGQNGEPKTETEWFAVVAWNKTAEICNQHLSRGSSVYVQGRMHTRTWDGQDGQKHSRTELIASQVLFLDKKPANNSEAPQEEDNNGVIEPNSIPF